MPRTVTIGADPELVVQDIGAARKLSRAAVPVCGLVGGEKGRPIIVGPEGGWLEDGVMLELNPTPHSDPTVVSDNIRLLREKADSLLAKKVFQTMLYSEAMYKPDQLAKFPQAMEFGCAPDLSAYNMGQPRECPMSEALERFGAGIRFAGGHVHIGVEDWPNELPKFVAVRFMDLFLGFPYARSRAMHDRIRSKFYGLPGLFRETSYGLEYRTPCNGWLQECDRGTPHFLGRAKLIAMLFSDFENTKTELVKLYNNVNWDAFYEAFTGDLRIDAATLLYDRTGVQDIRRIPIGPWQVSIEDYRTSTLRNGKLLPDIFDPAKDRPVKKEKVHMVEIEWDRDDEYMAYFYRRSYPENLNDRPIRGAEGKEWTEFWYGFGGIITDVDDRNVYVEFPDDSRYAELLPVAEQHEEVLFNPQAHVDLEAGQIINNVVLGRALDVQRLMEDHRLEQQQLNALIMQMENHRNGQ